jgi:hypothetical protein
MDGLCLGSTRQTALHYRRSAEQCRRPGNREETCTKRLQDLRAARNRQRHYLHLRMSQMRALSAQYLLVGQANLSENKSFHIEEQALRPSVHGDLREWVGVRCCAIVSASKVLCR